MSENYQCQRLNCSCVLPIKTNGKYFFLFDFCFVLEKLREYIIFLLLLKA